MSVQCYRDLKVWQLGMDVATAVYVLAREFPRQEIYGLTSQMQRAAVSIPANLAEGHARSTTKDFLRFVGIAQGSLAELETHLLLAERLDYSSPDRIAEMMLTLDELGRMLRALQKSLRAKLK